MPPPGGISIPPQIVSRLCLGKGSQTSSAGFYFAGFAILIDGRLLNIHSKLAFRVPHGVTDVMPKLGSLAANLTFCHWMSASIRSCPKTTLQLCPQMTSTNVRAQVTRYYGQSLSPLIRQADIISYHPD